MVIYLTLININIIYIINIEYNFIVYRNIEYITKIPTKKKCIISFHKNDLFKELSK